MSDSFDLDVMMKTIEGFAIKMRDWIEHKKAADKLPEEALRGIFEFVEEHKKQPADAGKPVNGLDVDQCEQEWDFIQEFSLSRLGSWALDWATRLIAAARENVLLRDTLQHQHRSLVEVRNANVVIAAERDALTEKLSCRNDELLGLRSDLHEARQERDALRKEVDAANHRITRGAGAHSVEDLYQDKPDPYAAWPVVDGPTDRAEVIREVGGCTKRHHAIWSTQCDVAYLFPDGKWRSGPDGDREAYWYAGSFDTAETCDAVLDAYFAGRESRP